VIDLLSANLGKAGPWADQYLFWLALAWLESGNYQAAADAFARVVNDFPASTNRLEAIVREATARFNLKDWAGVTNRLRQADGVFQQAAKATPDNEYVVRGYLLLSESQLALKDLPAAEESVQLLAKRTLNPALEWQRQFLLCRVQLAVGRTADALTSATNLATLAKPGLQAESVAGILERLGHLEPAVAVYEKNLSPDLPVEQRRTALIKVGELSMAQNKVADAIVKLEKYLAQFPSDATSDMALLMLGELRLNQYAVQRAGNAKMEKPELLAASTNLLPQALSHFDRIVTVFTNSEFLGRAQLGRGWCLWAGGKIPESKVAFQMAVDRLPVSKDQAVALFKLADAQYEQKDFAGAATNYTLVMDRYASMPEVQTNLFEPALYQLLQANLLATNLVGATNALWKILKEYPNSFYLNHSLLLVGQGLNRHGDPARARAIFSDLEKRVPNSHWLPEVELAIARTYEREKNWPAAINRYDAWVTGFTNHESLPRAEYWRAWNNYQAGNETNALALFTNFVARFSTNELAPLAQYWVADYYYRQGDFQSAENNYQLLYQKWPAPSELTFRARMLAGRAAFARLAFSDARKYFLDLINALGQTTNSPPELLAEAYLKLGDTIFEQFVANPAKPADDFNEAIRSYRSAERVFPTNRLAAAAIGSIGNRHFQLGDPKLYDQAIEAYQQVLTNSYADVAARSEAEVGLAKVLEKQAALDTGPARTKLLELALDHYLNVVYGKNLVGDEKPDLYWITQAGLPAGHLAEALKQWEQATKLYQRLLELLPPLKAVLEKRIEKARERSPVEKN
jgi:TolA-binding protein